VLDAVVQFLANFTAGLALAATTTAVRKARSCRRRRSGPTDPPQAEDADSHQPVGAR